MLWHNLLDLTAERMPILLARHQNERLKLHAFSFPYFRMVEKGRKISFQQKLCLNVYQEGERKGETAVGNKRYSVLLIWPIKTDILMTCWGDSAFLYLLGWCSSLRQQVLGSYYGNKMFYIEEWLICRHVNNICIICCTWKRERELRTFSSLLPIYQSVLSIFQEAGEPESNISLLQFPAFFFDVTLVMVLVWGNVESIVGDRGEVWRKKWLEITVLHI